MKSKVTVVLGLQWGDEGKGKILDVMAGEADWVFRAQGGNNAGHTVEIGGEKYVLHLVPSGILRSGVSCLIAGGAVVDPVSLVSEIEGLQERGIRTRARLHLASQAHLVLPHHRAVDRGSERKRGKGRIGTTGRGIGPAYADKAARVGLRAGELALSPQELSRRIRERIRVHNQAARHQGWEKISPGPALREIQGAAKILRPYLCDGVALAHRVVESGKRILIEGAQGTFLDVDHGTYPYVTSSHCTAGGACTGTGVPPTAIRKVIGVLKAYTTRVGSGPFVTEDGALGHLLHGMGREFGSTTGRARRCGWFDAVLVRRAVRLNGVTELAMTNLDGLDGLEKIPVCVGYRLQGKLLQEPPVEVVDWERCRPVYRVFPGWCEPTTEARRWRDLPAKARSYLLALSKLVGAPLGILSVGAGREQTFRHG
ncbi:MAG: adenylosuccinate synthase [Verrucomicrobia bacterium]|nr:adenylosuccinate synthase [Verrucomicrobiota bacterium]